MCNITDPAGKDSKNFLQSSVLYFFKDDEVIIKKTPLSKILRICFLPNLKI